MERKLVIGSGWCGWKDEEVQRHAGRSKLCLTESWLTHYWGKSILIQAIPEQFYIYASNCEVYPDFDLFMNVAYGNTSARELNPRHDFNCSLLMPAQYAECNDMDFLYIEQDCLVWGLQDIINYARSTGKNILYGFGEDASLQPGWAEQSLIYVKREFMPEFLCRMNREAIHNSKTNIPEILFHNLFKDTFTPWPFGVGRKRPIPWGDDVFYFQQPTDEEIKIYMEKLNAI